MLSVIIVGTFATSRALAMPDFAAISAHCRDAQNLMSQLEKVDAVQRINRGRLYTDTLNLLFAMNARLSANHLVATDLAQITSDFANGFSTFRDDYDRYDDSLNNAINVDCANNPQTFYDQLTVARGQRAQLAADIANLDQLLKNYQTTLDNSTKGIAK